jgi:epidermal growth factor receptor substrate 15
MTLKRQNNMRFAKVFLRSIILIYLFLSVNFVFSQDPEAVIKSKAEKAFKNENFVEASKYYSQLLSFNMTNPDYNYRYGICLLTNSRKKNDAIKHLTFASKVADFDAEVFYYLGKAYHLDYNFNEAIKNYNLYISKVGSKENKDLQVDLQIKMSENGKRLLSSANEVVVLNKQEIEDKSFFRIYDLNNIGGNMIVTAQFQSKIDKKRNHTPLIHFPNNPKRIFYSSYGEEEKTGKDIYMRQRLPDGTWSEAQKVNGGVNTNYDEDFPYIHPKGDFLYFSSKGHNSMGGYDIFRARYDEESNSFAEPENIDFPISSPDDDLFYIVDSLDKNACFSSARQSLDGKIHVYNVKVEKVPIQLVAVKSYFTDVPNPDNKKVSVEVFDYSTSKKIGTFNANPKGGVLITFPKGGKYEYVVKIPGVSKEFREIVSIPFLKEFKPLKQRIIHENEPEDLVKIINLFDEDVDDSYEVMAEIAKIRGELNPNLDQFDIAELESKADNKQVYTKLGMSKFNDIEVIQKLEELVDNQEKKKVDLENIKEKSIGQAIESVRTINQLQDDLKTTVAKANTKEGTERRSLFEDAGKIVNELNYLDDYIDMLLQTADSLSPIIRAKENDIIKYNRIVEELRKIYQAGDLKEFGKRLNEDLSELLALQKENPEFVTASLNNQILAKHEEMNVIEAKINGLKANLAQEEKDLEDLKKQLSSAKSKEKPDIQRKVDEKSMEIEMSKIDIKTQNNKLMIANEKLLKLEASLAYFQEILNSAVSPSNASVPEVMESFKSTDDQNTRTLKNYVEEQLRELGVEMASLKSPSEQKKINKPTTSLARNIDNNESNGIRIKGQSTDSKETNITVNNEIKPDTKSEPNTKTNEVETNVETKKENSTINETIETKTETTKEVKPNVVNSTVETKNENTTIKETKPAVKTNEVATNIETKKETPFVLETKESKSEITNPTFNNRNESVVGVVAKVSKDTEANKKAINSNSNMTEEQKLKAVLRQDKNLVFNTGKEIELLESKVTNGTASKKVEKDLEELKVFQSNLKEDITKQEEILSNKYPKGVNEAAWNEDQLKEMLNPNYQKTIDAIVINKGLSEVSKAKLTKMVDEQFLTTLKKDRVRTADELSKKPTDQALKIEIKLLDNLINETQKSIDKNQMLISTYTVNQTLKAVGSEFETNEVAISEDKEKQLLDKFRSDFLKGNTSILDKEYSTIDDLEKQNNVLENYYNLLSEKQFENEKKLAIDENVIELKQENRAISNELELVRKKIEGNESKIEELDLKILAENYMVLNSEVSSLKQEENDLKLQLKDASTPKKEKSELAKKIIENQNKQVEKYEELNKLQSALLTKYSPNKIRSKRLSKIPQNVLDSLEYLRFLKTDTLISSDLKIISATKSDAKKAKMLPQLLDKQEANSIIAQHLLYNYQMKKHLRQVEKYSENIYSLQSNKTLEKSKFALRDAHEEIRVMIAREKLLLTKAKKKMKAQHVNKIAALKKELDVIEQLQKELEEELKSRVKYAQEFKKRDAKQIVVTDAERDAITSNPTFYKAQELYVQRKMAFDAMKLLFDNLEMAKENYNKAILDFANDPTKINKQFANQMFEALKVIYKQYYELRNKYEALTNNYLTETKGISNLPKYEQLFEEAYTSEVAKLNAKKAEQSKTNEEDENLSLVEDKINFSNEVPDSGFVYQVFIGNLDKPLKSSLILKLGTVNATMLPNGQTAYFTQFTDINEANDLLKEIQKAGYSNAEIQGYKDGQLMSKQETLLATSTKNDSNKSPVIETKDDSKIANKKESITNDSPIKKSSSVKIKTSKDPFENFTNATPIESKPGLFFTVQIGAYHNRKFPSTLTSIDNVFSKKFADGVLRYSTGVFHSVAEARGTKQTVIGMGVTDAFITAYYKGERITIAEAEKILAENGIGILENK